MQERLESSVLGRALISVVLVVLLSATFVHVMPDSILKSKVYGPAHSFVTFLGMGQEWGMFSPEAPRQVTYTEALIRYADGSSGAWSVPHRRGVMEYSDYHWHLFATMVAANNLSHLRPGFAEYLANAEAAGRDPVEVTLVRRWAPIAPPGVMPPHGPLQEQVLLVQPLGGPR